MKEYALGIDIGGTNAKFAWKDIRTGKIETCYLPISPLTLESLTDMIEQIKKKIQGKIALVGISITGGIKEDQLVISVRHPKLVEEGLNKAHLSKMLNTDKIYMLGDAHAATGAVPVEFPDMWYDTIVILSAGTGMAVGAYKVKTKEFVDKMYNIAYQLVTEEGNIELHKLCSGRCIAENELGLQYILENPDKTEVKRVIEKAGDYAGIFLGKTQEYVKPGENVLYYITGGGALFPGYFEVCKKKAQELLGNVHIVKSSNCRYSTAIGAIWHAERMSKEER